ncbi:DUF2878 domain-containing protein [Gallaecimonas kandeliae]|uniref:DUF2878 domain-containing protein n=1 Tax=Gallaecimonas kandeliae TaxID=3029055 RepID=UPI0026488A6D|nr:DUF2878 domain-containing protein [Gallaecimonas kandeliae]WKE63939.1 DUF2878 domain-containing protein [Gallaecimonas kandeliae]
MPVWLNLLLFQLAWLAAVLWQSPWAVAALLALHLALSPKRRNDALLMAALVLAGLAVDGSLSAAGVLDFGPGPWPVPPWLLALWAAFGMLPNHGLAWLKTRPWLAAVLGALGGPFAYWAGVRLGAVSFGWPLGSSLAVLALVWALLLPLLMRRGTGSLS